MATHTSQADNSYFAEHRFVLKDQLGNQNIWQRALNFLVSCLIGHVYVGFFFMMVLINLRNH